MVPLRILPPTIQIIGRIQHTPYRETPKKNTSSGQPHSEEMNKWVPSSRNTISIRDSSTVEQQAATRWPEK